MLNKLLLILLLSNILFKALVSLGKHGPPNEYPRIKIFISYSTDPIDFNTLYLSAFNVSHKSDIILAKDNFVVINPLIDILTISASIGFNTQYFGLFNTNLS